MFQLTDLILSKNALCQGIILGASSGEGALYVGTFRGSFLVLALHVINAELANILVDKLATGTAGLGSVE